MGIYRGKKIRDAQESVTNSASALTDREAVSYILQADPDNTDDLFLGNSSSQNLQLTPGQSITITIEDLSEVYAVSASGTQNLNVFAVS